MKKVLFVMLMVVLMASIVSASSVHFSADNLNVYMTGENRPERTGSYVDYEGNTRTWTSPQESAGALQVYANNEEGPMYFAPENMEMSVSRYNNEGDFSVRGSFTLMETADLQLGLPIPEFSMDLNRGGMDFWGRGELNRAEEYIYDSETDDGYFIVSDNLEGQIDWSMKNSIISQFNPDLNDDTVWVGDVLVSAIRVSGWWDGEFLGTGDDLVAFNSAFPMQEIPEPLTLSLFTLGSLLLWRRNKPQSK